jgi:excisionase family DNA binding protein
MITVAEAAKRLNVSELTIRRWIWHGHLTAYRLGSKLIRLHADEVDQFATPTLGSRTTGDHQPRSGGGRTRGSTSRGCTDQEIDLPAQR